MAYSTRQTRGIYCIETIWYGDASPPSGSHWATCRQWAMRWRWSRRCGGEKPTEEALRARAADFSEERAANAYLALFEELLKARVP